MEIVRKEDIEPNPKPVIKATAFALKIKIKGRRKKGRLKINLGDSDGKLCDSDAGKR